MGLDMWLVSKDRKPDYKEEAYWRKANAIHKYFVDKVNGGEDDQQLHSEVTREILEDLRDRCQKITENHELAEELLPTESGFFFGSTAYNEWYFDDITETLNICNHLLSNFNFEDRALYYDCWW